MFSWIACAATLLAGAGGVLLGRYWRAVSYERAWRAGYWSADRTHTQRDIGGIAVVSELRRDIDRLIAVTQHPIVYRHGAPRGSHAELTATQAVITGVVLPTGESAPALPAAAG